MNRIYTLAALLLIGGGLTAQRVNRVPIKGFSKTEMTSVAIHPNSTPADEQRGGTTTVFTEDFANGLAGNNGIGAWTTSGPNGNVWVYTHTGPNGAWSTPATQIITSPTAANGFMNFASDSANTNWSLTPPAMIPVPVALVGSLVSPVLDLSATPFVEIQFQQSMRFCCSDDSPGHFVEVSTDGGATWPIRLATDLGIVDNAVNGTQLRAVNLSSAISADPSNVRLRFTQDGLANEITHYYWQIDDINIITLPATDMKLTKNAMTIWDFATANSYDSLDYSVFPVSELRGRALNLGYTNNGSTTADNVVARFSTTDGYDQSLAAVSVIPGMGNTVFAPLWTPTNTIGTHTVNFEVTSDGTENSPADNLATSSIKVSQFIYARDNGSRENGINDTDAGAPFTVTNWMHTKVAETIYSVDVVFSSTSAVGVEVVGVILDDTRTPIAETQFHTIVTADRSPLGGANFISLLFDSPVPLDAGGDYAVGLKHFGGANVVVGTSGTSQPQTSNIYQETTDTWFYTTTTPMVRMNFNPSVGIAEADMPNGIGLGQSYPNPANASAFVDYSLKTSSNVTMELRDMSGKLVRTLAQGNMAAGTHRVNINTANLDAGVYFYTLNTNGAVATKRMTVVH